MYFLYNILINILQFIFPFLGFLNTKIKKGNKGRKNWQKQLLDWKHIHSKPVIWVHVSSLGEYEQGKPVLKRLLDKYGDTYEILLTFFSPSGYELQKSTPLATGVFYLPIDTLKNARKFIHIVQPKLAVWVKYDFWPNFLKQLHNNGVPILLVSAIFRRNQRFFTSKFWRKVLDNFHKIFVQNAASQQLLAEHGIANSIVAGDTRLDSVLQITENPLKLNNVEERFENKKVFIAGSTWGADEKLLQQITFDGKIIIAPHNVDVKHIKQIQQKFPDSVLYTDLLQGKILSTSSVLIINTIGVLKHLYQYAHIVYIGGGFNKSGIHNILEPAVFAKPIIFGPNYTKFMEAVDLVRLQAAYSITTAPQLQQQINKLLENNDCEKAGLQAQKYVREHAGATEKIIDYVEEKRLLT